MVPFQRPSYDKLTKDGCLCVLHIIDILETHREGFGSSSPTFLLLLIQPTNDLPGEAELS